MKSLVSMYTYKLQVLEVGQHVKSVLKGIDDLGNGLITDAVLQNYLSQLGASSVEYDKAMLKVMKSDETEKIAQADAERDKAITATLRQISAYELSDDATEFNASVSLNTLFNTYKNIQKWNFEEESNGIDNLLVDLESEKYAAHIAELNMQSFVERIRSKNERFKELFAGRTQEKVNTEYYDTKALRADLTSKYNVMIEYVLVLARALDQDQYNKPLDVINTVRKYYADLLAKRKGSKKDEVAEPIPPME